MSSEGEGIGEKMVIKFVNLNVPNFSTNVGIYTKIYTKLLNNFLINCCAVINAVAL